MPHALPNVAPSSRSIGAVNELVNVELNRVGKLHKPIQCGLVTERGARSVAGVSLVEMLTLSFTFDVASLLLCALGTVTACSH